MKNTVIGLLLLLGLSVGFPVTAEIKVGYVDSQKLVDLSGERQSILQKLQGEFTPIIKKLTSKQQKIIKIEEEFKKNQMLLSDQQRKKKEAELVRLKLDFKHAQESYQADVEIRRAEELAKLEAKVRDEKTRILKIIDAYAKEHNFDIILTEGVLFVADRVNVTADIRNLIQ